MKDRYCKMCGAPLEGIDATQHNELDEWMIKLILERQPDWKETDGTCSKCWSALEKMRNEADAIAFL